MVAALRRVPVGLLPVLWGLAVGGLAVWGRLPVRRWLAVRCLAVRGRLAVRLLPIRRGLPVGLLAIGLLTVGLLAVRRGLAIPWLVLVVALQWEQNIHSTKCLPDMHNWCL